MKKRYKVRFYKAHDLDLITYIASHSIDIRVTLYYVVRAYCNGTVVGIRMPEQTGPRPSEYNMIYYTYLYLDFGRLCANHVAAVNEVFSNLQGDVTLFMHLAIIFWSLGASDPDGNRTRVTAVKGRCLNRLTTGPFAAPAFAVTVCYNIISAV